MQPNRPSSGSGGLGVPVEAGVTHAGSSTRTVPLAPALPAVWAGQGRWCPRRRGRSGRWCSRPSGRRRAYSRPSGRSRVHRGERWLVSPRQRRPPPSGGAGALLSVQPPRRGTARSARRACASPDGRPSHALRCGGLASRRLHSTRLETRTKECSRCASFRAAQTRVRNEGEGEIRGSPRREPFLGAAHRRPIPSHAVAGFE